MDKLKMVMSVFIFNYLGTDNEDIKLQLVDSVMKKMTIKPDLL